MVVRGVLTLAMGLMTTRTKRKQFIRAREDEAALGTQEVRNSLS